MFIYNIIFINNKTARIAFVYLYYNSYVVDIKFLLRLIILSIHYCKIIICEIFIV